MKDASFRITLDVNEIQSQVSIPVKVGDTNRKIYISLTEDGVPFAIGEGDYAILTGTSRSGLNIERTCTIEGGKIVVDFDDDIVSSECLLTCEIRLYNFETNGVLCSASFSIVVYDRVATFPKEELETAGYDVDYIDNIILAEETREEKETERIRAENIRVDNEKARCDAESERVIEFNRVKTETETATENANKATEEISGLIPAANEAVNNANTQAEYAKTQAERAEAVADNIEDEVEGIYREITGVVDFDLVENEYVKADGSFTTFTGWDRTDYINCEGLTTITIEHSFTSSQEYNVFYTSELKEDGTIEHAYLKRLYLNPDVYEYAVPQGATALVLSGKAEDIAKISVFTVPMSEKITNLEEEQKGLKDNISEQDAVLEATNDRVAVLEDSLIVEEEIDYEVVPREYVNEDGTITKGSTGWSRTEAVKCTPGSVFDITGASSKYNAFYNSDGSFNSAFSIPCEKMIVPDGATSFMLSTTNEEIGNIKITRYTTLSEQISKKVSSVNGVAPDENGNVEIAIPISDNDPGDVIPPFSVIKKCTETYFIDQIEDKISSVPDGNSFLFVTDMHNPKNKCNSYMPMLYAYKKLGLKTVVHGGDVLDANATKGEAARELQDWTNDMRWCFGRYMLPVFGNHDANYADMTFSTATLEDKKKMIVPYSVVEKIFLSGCKHTIVQETDEEIQNRIKSFGITVDDTVGDTDPDLYTAPYSDMDEYIAWHKLHYYFDDVDNKTRHIIINKVDSSPLLQKFYGGRVMEIWLQLDWLYEVLRNTPDDYNIVLTGHSMIDYSNNINLELDSATGVNPMFAMMKLLSLAKTNGVGTFKTLVGVSETNLTIYNEETTYDFSSNNRTGKIICLCGHSHWDAACVCHTVAEIYKSDVYTDDLTIGDDGILVIMTQTDAIGGSVWNDMYNPSKYAGVPTPMTENTVTEQCFDIVTLTDDKVVCTRIGAGEDRVFNY